MEKIVLKAIERKIGKKSDLNELRKRGRIPGVFYSGHDQAVAIDVPDKALKPLVYTSETHLVSLEIEGGSSFDCVLKDVQFDPITDKVIHFDLFGLTTGEKIQIEVPLRLVGNAAGIRDGGILTQVLHKLDVKCLPNDMPTHIDVDVSKLNVGDSLHVSDLNLESLDILTVEDTVVASVTHAKQEKVAEQVETEEITEPEVISKGKAETEE
jgi:large subunit ribosomal protein L25